MLGGLEDLERRGADLDPAHSGLVIERYQLAIGTVQAHELVNLEHRVVNCLQVGMCQRRG